MTPRRVLRIAVEPVCMVGVLVLCVILLAATLPGVVYAWWRDRQR